MFENIKQDYCRRHRQKATILRILLDALRSASFRAVFLYRIGRWCRDRHLTIIALFMQRLMSFLCHCQISTTAKIGPGFTIGHGFGIVIPPGAVLGKNCHILQNSSIGGNFGKKDKEGRIDPIIGDNVTIGAGAAVLGPIKIGSNSIIGANATLTTSVPENSVVGAFRGEVIAQLGPEGQIIHLSPRFTLSRKELYEQLEELGKRVEELEKRVR